MFESLLSLLSLVSFLVSLEESFVSLESLSPSLLSFESLISSLSIVVVSTKSLETFLTFSLGEAFVDEFFLDRLSFLTDELSLVELLPVELEDESSFLVSSSRSKDGVGGGL